MKSILNHLIELLFPRLCQGCGQKLLSDEEYVCVECLIKLPRTNYSFIRENPLEQLFSGRILFQRIASFSYFAKDGVLQNLVHQLKYDNQPELGVFLGRLAYREMECSGFFQGIDYLLPVPLHPKKLKLRGYNQSFQLAKGISAESGIAIDTESLQRIVNNPSQTTKSRMERWENVSGIFEMTPVAVKLKHKHVLLVDDILTTGSTLEASAKALLQTKGTKISVFVLGSAI